jgi:hypothetical protein
MASTIPAMATQAPPPPRTTRSGPHQTIDIRFIRLYLNIQNRLVDRPNLPRTWEGA